MYDIGAGEGLRPFDPLTRPALRFGVRVRPACELGSGRCCGRRPRPPAVPAAVKLGSKGAQHLLARSRCSTLRGLALTTKGAPSPASGRPRSCSRSAAASAADQRTGQDSGSRLSPAR